MNFSTILFAVLVILQAVIYGLAANAQSCLTKLATSKKNEIENIYFMNFDQAAITHPASDILSCYLDKTHLGDKSLNQQLLEVYKKMDSYKRTGVLFGNAQLKELENLGLPYDWKDLLSSKIKAGDVKQLKAEVDKVQSKVGNEIEMSDDYKNYKKLIFSKYN